MAGTLYGIGVGPGDPELLTLKAARLLREVPVVAVPVTRVGGDSYALEIASGFLNPSQKVLRLFFPMLKDVEAKRGHREASALEIAREMRAGRDVAFLTEGDPLVHSTFIYVLRHLPEGLPVEIVPGVSSIMASAAQAKTPLVSAEGRLAVVPATFENREELRQVLRDFDTVVLLKFHRVFEQVLDLLDEMGLLEDTILVERASHPDGRVVCDLRPMLEGAQGPHYLSLLIVHAGRGTPED